MATRRSSNTSYLPVRHPLTLALQGVLLAMASTTLLQPGEVFAADAVPASQQGAASQRQAYRIPAGPLGQVLSTLAVESGVSLTMPSGLLQGRMSPGLQGTYSVREGLAVLLDGSGLEAVATGPGTFVLRVAQAVEDAQSPASLPAVKVIARAERSAITEGSGSFTVRSAATATKLQLSPRETPQSVSVLTREQMDAQGLITLDDAVQNVTGLVMQRGYYAGQSGNFSARGFQLDNMMIDGLPVSLGGNGTANADNADLAIYDRMEVVRGATGLLSGSGTPSASINLVRKRPTAEPQASMQVSVGSWDTYRVQVDGSNALNEARTVRGRAVVSVQSGETFTGQRDDSHQLYGILEADLSSSTKLTVGAHYRKQDSDRLYSRLPTRDDGSFLDVPRSTNLGNDFDKWDQTNHTLFAELDQRLGDGWRARLSATRMLQDVDMRITSFNATGGEFHQGTQAYVLNGRQTSLDASITGPFPLLGRDHELVAGVGYRAYDNQPSGGWASYTWNGQGPLINPGDWDTSATPLPAINYSQWGFHNRVKQTGVYGAARFSLADPLKLIAGARVSWYDYENLVTNDGYKVDSEVTPYAGLIFDLDKQHSLYASWTRIFQPQESRDINQNLLDPITGTNIEAGVKGEYFKGRLNASLAVFQIRQQNRAIDDTSSPNPCPGSSYGYCQRASGEVKSEGVEAEVSGALTSRWQLMAGYAYVSAKYTKDSDSTNVGKLFDTDYPRHQFKLSTSYHLPGALARWHVGGSVYAQNSIYNDQGGGVRITQKGYALVGLSASYDVDDNASVRLNINNAFDKRYYEGIGWLTGGNQVGAPRNVMLTLNYKL